MQGDKDKSRTKILPAMPVRQWLRENSKGILGGVVQAVVNVFGSLIAFSEQVSKSVGITFSPLFFLILLAATFIGTGLIAWNERDKATRRKLLDAKLAETKKLFGEPDGNRGAVRTYSKRYLLPRLYEVAEQAEAVTILGKNCFYWAIIDPDSVKKILNSNKSVTMLMVDPSSAHASEGSDEHVHNGEEVQFMVNIAFRELRKLRDEWEATRVGLQKESKLVLKTFKGANHLSFVIFDEGKPSARIQTETHSASRGSGSRNNEIVLSKDDQLEYDMAYAEFLKIARGAEEVPL